MSNKTYKARLGEVKNIQGEIWQVSLHLDEQFHFVPGQYIWLILPNNGKRAFSITSQANTQNNITIIFRNNPDSQYKKTLQQLPVGTNLTIEGPFGAGIVLTQNVVFLGEGVGIAPFLGVVRNLPAEQQFEVLFLSFHTPEAPALYDAELNEKAQHIKQFHYESGVRGTESEVLREVVKQNTNSIWYIAGSQQTVDVLWAFLQKNGVIYENMRFEEHYPHLADNFYLTSDMLLSESGPRYFKYIAEQSLNHIVITDVDGVIIYANKAAEALTGFTYLEMKGHTPRLWGGLMPPEFYTVFWKTIKQDKLPFKGELTNRNKNGEAYQVIATVTPILEGEKLVAFLGVEEDISAHSALEIEYKQKTTELERTNNLMVDRELRMVELKKQVEALKIELLSYQQNKKL